MMTTTERTLSSHRVAERAWIPARLRDERGVALILVLLMAIAVAVLAIGSTMIAVNSGAVHKMGERQSTLIATADAGLEVARSRVNGDSDLYPDSGYEVLEDRVAVTDVDGDTIPGIRRTTWVGPTGISTGQYGVFGSVVTLTEDEKSDNRIVRRREIRQESFAKYAYFTVNEGINIWFGGGDQLFGPVHSNDRIKIHPTGVTFHGPVTTAKDIFQKDYATFKQGYTEYVRSIPLPEMAELAKLETQAKSGKTNIDGDTGGNYGEATTRIEFIALDLNGDGDTTDRNEGFMRVYQARNASRAPWVVAGLPGDYFARGLRNSENCGHYDKDGKFVAAKDLSNSEWADALASPTRRCLLGGSDSLWGQFKNSDSHGGWLKWPGEVSDLLDGRDDKDYLWPINRPLNPDFKGVVYVDGKVAVSGELRGRITLAATGDIILADDLTYAIDPSSATCSDILGIFSARDVIVPANTINMPVPRKRPGSLNNPYLTFDDTKDEFFHMVVLALRNFTVQWYWTGSRKDEACEATPWGRGCLYLTGGIIQETRGAVGTTLGTGYLKRYAYDQCSGTDPPPYFPTTNHFVQGQYYEVDPTGFDIDAYWAQLSAD